MSIVFYALNGVCEDENTKLPTPDISECQKGRKMVKFEWKQLMIYYSLFLLFLNDLDYKLQKTEFVTKNMKKFKHKDKKFELPIVDKG